MELLKRYVRDDMKYRNASPDSQLNYGHGSESFEGSLTVLFISYNNHCLEPNSRFSITNRVLLLVHKFNEFC